MEYVNPHITTPARIRNQEIEYRSIPIASTPRSGSMRAPQTEPRPRYSSGGGFPPAYPSSTSKLSVRSSSAKSRFRYETEPFEEYADSLQQRRKSKPTKKPKKVHKKEDTPPLELEEDEKDESVTEEDEEAQPIRKRLGMAPRLGLKTAKEANIDSKEDKDSDEKIDPVKSKKVKSRKSIPKPEIVSPDVAEADVSLSDGKKGKLLPVVSPLKEITSDSPKIQECLIDDSKNRTVKTSITTDIDQEQKDLFEQDFHFDAPIMDDDYPEEPNLDTISPDNTRVFDKEKIPIDDEQNKPTIQTEFSANESSTEKFEKKTKKKRVRNTVTAKKVKTEAFDFKDYLKDEYDDDGTRKSKRTRIAPIAFWKNEKVVYSRRDSGIVPGSVIQQVIRIASDDEAPVKYKPKQKFKIKKETQPEIPEKMEVINILTKQEELQSIFFIY
jgi:hypothetical protein